LLSITPPSSYYKEWHEKELAPTWNKDLLAYDLVYYRPILFMSSEGKVARKGWVGNIGSTTCPPVPMPSLDDTPNMQPPELNPTLSTCISEKSPLMSFEKNSTSLGDKPISVCAACRLHIMCGCALNEIINNSAVKPRATVPNIQCLTSPQPIPQDYFESEQTTTMFFKQTEIKQPKPRKSRQRDISTAKWSQLFRHF